MGTHPCNFVNRLSKILSDLQFGENFHRFSNFLKSVNIVDKILPNLASKLVNAWKRRGGEHYWIEEKEGGGKGNEEWEKGEEAVNSEIEEEQEKRR